MKIFFQEDGKTIEFIEEYNNEGNLIKLTEFKETRENRSVIDRIVKFNDKGKITKIIRYSKDGKKIDYVEEYNNGKRIKITYY